MEGVAGPACVVARLCGCAKCPAGAGEFDCVEDWGYINRVTGSESSFCVWPVTWSHLLGFPIGRGLGLRQPRLTFRHPSGTIIGDFCLSCILFWWYIADIREGKSKNN